MSNCSLKMVLQSQDQLGVCDNIFMLTLSQVLTKFDRIISRLSF
jgi:hypothetical protein